MNLVEKLYSFIIFSAVLIGIGISQFELVQTNADSFILPLLIIMLYITFLQIPLKEIRNAFKNIKFTLTSILINFIWTPVSAWLLAELFLTGNPAVYIGFIMLMVTPCTDWYLVFTSIAKGNLALSTAVLPLNFLLQIIFLPVYLLIFSGETAMIRYNFLIESILTVLFLPFLLALLTKWLLRKKQKWRVNLADYLSILPVIFLSLAILAMFASQGQLLLEHLEVLWTILLPLLLFFSLNFILSQNVGQLMHFSIPDRVSLSLTTLARNSPVALAIAVTAFPHQPLIALTLVIGPLIELPVLAVFSRILIVINKRQSN